MKDKSHLTKFTSAAASRAARVHDPAAELENKPATEAHATVSLSDIARARFLEGLFDRRIEPGAFVSQSDLVRILDVPVSPLRDALRVLQTEGWLTIHARSGIEICKPDFELVRNSYQLRLVLERAAIRSFAEMASLARIKALELQHREVIAEVEGCELVLDQARRLEGFDQAFHLEVIGVLRNPMIERAYQQAQSFVHLIRLDREYRLSWLMVIRTMNEHLEILKACYARDPAAAEAALEAHFASAMQRAIGFY